MSSKIPPHDEEFSGDVDLGVAIDDLIKSLEDFKKKKTHIIRMNFESSMFHMKLDIKLAER